MTQDEIIDNLTAKNLELVTEINRLRQQLHHAPGLSHPDFRRKMRDRVAIALLSAWETHSPGKVLISEAMDCAEDFILESEKRYDRDRKGLAARRARARDRRDDDVPADAAQALPPGSNPGDPVARPTLRRRKPEAPAGR